MLCIAQSSQLDRDDRRRSSPEAWLKPAAEMRAPVRRPARGDRQYAPSIARRCAFGAPKRKPILPSLAGDTEAEAEQLRRDARAGLEARLALYRDLTRGGAEGLFRPARLRGRHHRPDGLSGLLPDRRRLHQMGQGERHSGRPGPRLGRRLGGRLGADHHRSRSDPARPAVRALPQSRARVDAGLRHRLLRNPARRGDPLRPAALRHATRSPRSSPSGS